MFCFKLLNHDLTSIFNNFVTFVSDIHDHNTKSAELLYIHTPRTIYAEHSVKHQALLFWNTLNLNLRNETCLVTLKRSVKAHLLTDYKFRM